MKHSGFECPIKFVTVPKNYKRVVGEDGLIYFIPPKGAEVPEELRHACDSQKLEKNA